MRPPIALISSNKAAWSETFIRAQRELLPAEAHFLYGAWLPRYKPDGRHFIANFPPWESLVYFRDWLLKRPLHHTLRKKIRAYLIQHKIQAVLAQYGPSGVEMLPFCRELGLPLIVHFHGYDAHDAELLNEYQPRYPEMFAEAAAIVSVSQSMTLQLQQLGAPIDKLHYNPCGADLRQFRPTNPGKNPPRFLAAGRFSGTKAPHLTLQAFEMVAQKVPEARLTMAGDGPLRSLCIRQAKLMGLEDKVDFPCVLSHQEVADNMRQARAFVQHSITTRTGDSEGTPVAIMEAGASGLPVVSTLHAGIPEVVIHEETGYLVAERDTQNMASAMIGLAKFPEIADRMGQAARLRIEEKFSLEKRIERLWGIIQSTMN